MINNIMKKKYAPKSKCTGNKKGRPSNPQAWIMGPDEVQRDKYYAWLKHRCQAKFRKEEYELTWEDWQKLWPHELYILRGRKITDYCLSRLDLKQPWTYENCLVARRDVYLQRNREYRDARS